VSELSAVTLSLLGLTLLVTLCLSIMILRRDHPHHVHTLWYIFSLTLCSVSVLFLYIYENATSGQNTFLSGTPGTIATFFIDTSMDVRGELHILAILGALFILPQILSYLISGLFGCGSPPVLVSTISKVVTWSFIKFLCILSGILAAQSIFALYGHPYLYPKDSIRKCVDAIFMISLSFFIMVMYYKVEVLHAFIVKRPRLKRFESFARFMTRYRKSPV